MEILIAHDIRQWHLSDTTDHLSREHWSASSLARSLTALRHEMAGFFARHWHFAWNLSDPTQWRMVRGNPKDPKFSKWSRGRTKHLELVDLTGLVGRVHFAAWDSWLGLPDRLGQGLQEPARPATIEPSNGSGDGTPPSGSILGHPGAFVYPQGSTLRDAILLRYFELAGHPHPTQWQKVLPPTIPKSEFFAVFDWQRIAKLVGSPG